jgi:formylmethanofuran dehydrogenase subunit B
MNLKTQELQNKYWEKGSTMSVDYYLEKYKEYNPEEFESNPVSKINQIKSTLVVGSQNMGIFEIIFILGLAYALFIMPNIK